MASERAVPGFVRATELDDARLVSASLPELSGNVTLRTTVEVPEPRRGAAVCVAEILFHTSADRSYAVQLRVRTGVRYVRVVRQEGAAEEILADEIMAYDFGRALPLEVAVTDGRITVIVDSRTAASVVDPEPLDGGGVGIGAVATAARFGPVVVTTTGPRTTTDLRPAVVPVPDLTGAVVEPSTTVENGGYRLVVSAARWQGGSGYVAELFIRDAGGRWRCVAGRRDERWSVLHGTNGSRRNLWALDRYPVVFHGYDKAGPAAISLRGSHPDLFELRVTWRLDRRHPVVHIELTPRLDGRFVVAYQALAATPAQSIDEVLCGPLQNGRRVGGPTSVGRDELFAPMCLVQRGDLTTGLFAPADELPFEYESALGDDDQPFGMGLRNPAGDVQTVLFAPQYGCRADLRVGVPYCCSAGIYAARGTIWDGYRDLLRGEYGYAAYRRNAFGTSLTDTVHNLVDLLKAGPDKDDAVEFQASPSGWWSRAKGFIDIENDQAVRATTTGVLLGAYYLTGDDDLYEKRALPTVEFHLSRNGYGWTPRDDATVYGDPSKNAVCGTPFGVPALAPLYAMTRGGVAAVRRLAVSALDREDYWLKRTPMSGPLAAYRMTRAPALLARAEEAAERYLAEPEPTDPADPHDFAIYYCKAWIELLEMFEETGRRTYLDAAHREARRFATMVFARPVPDRSVTVPGQPLFIDRQIELAGWWDPAQLYAYPATDVPDEEVPAWLVSPTGLSIEALNTYRFNGFTLNPAWAPFLLRLATHTGDDLLRDVAHNAVKGRFTNYPGYYYRQLSVNHVKPDFPYRGPFGNTTVYYHHAPAQLGLAIDYLMAEHETRSGGAIDFPSEFEQNYVWFAYRVYGHRPGRFHGYDGVWPWLPKGLVRLDTEQVNWIAGHDGERLFLSLTNACAEPVEVAARLDPARVPIRPGAVYDATVIRDSGPPKATTVTDHHLETTVSGHGITALIVHGVGPIDEPAHRASVPVGGFEFDDGAVGPVRGILIPKPDGRRYHAYVQAAAREPATLHYSLDGGATIHRRESVAYPNEWTVPVDDLSAAFSYYVTLGDRHSRAARLSCRWEA
jgi:hypothetical protein